MNMETREKLDAYYTQAGSWADERTQSIHASRKVAWIVALVASVIALLLALTIIFMLPLKTIVPQTLLVDKQTGFVQAIDPRRPQKISADEALTRSFLAQYVVAREGFDIATVQGQFKKVALWSAGAARNRYISMMQAGHPDSPLTRFPRNTVIDVEIRSVSKLSNDSALVRFATSRNDPGAAAQPEENWVAVIRYRYSNAPMTFEDRLVNPLGFEVTSYHKDAESLPVQLQAENATGPKPVIQPPMPESQPLQPATPRASGR
jgi:type IV secretion system protein VirB8